MFNNYQTHHNVQVRKRGPLNERIDQIVSKKDQIEKQFDSKINVNSLILFLIVVVVLYCNSGSIHDQILILLSQSQNNADLLHSEPIQQAIAITIPPKVENKPLAYSRNDKIDWDGCLYEMPLPDPNRKHIVPPPRGPITLVCCNTTAGVLNIEVHHQWAYNGANRFLEMVRDGFFSSKVGLFRALKSFLVQFGLAGDPELQKRYHQKGNLRDDKNWLPEGPPGREINGVKRFQQGEFSALL